jgi:response regulator of citrate/malate metabolism
MTKTHISTLIVDDDYRVASIHAAYVSRVDGFSVAGQSHSASEATEAVEALKPDLVLMDVYLPDSDGLTVIRRLMENREHPDFIVITAARDVSTVRTAMQLGAVHYLVKPFGFEVLRERLLSYHHLREQMASLDNAAQADVDALYGLLRGANAPAAMPAKGHSAPTLELVRNAVKSAAGDVSASEVADAIGVSRATAQRYLMYLARHGVVRLQLRYGAAGRPEHRYTTS